MFKNYDVVVIGAGVSGVGVGIILRHFGVEKMAILERESVGTTFRKWPREMRFITPSFPSNQFGMLDLNSVAIATSPGYSLGREHPTGIEYSHYLEGVAEHFDLPIQCGIDVCAVEKIDTSEHESGADKGFRIHTSQGEIRAKFVVWAAGEFAYPNLTPFEGAELCVHNSQVESWRELRGENFVVIGGYESGIDAAYHLVMNGKRVRVLDANAIAEEDGYDPSISLSPFTQVRLDEALDTGRIELIPAARAQRVTKTARGYKIFCDDATFFSPTRPVLATGFRGSLHLVREHFVWNENSPVLSAVDESTLSPNLFVCGPMVKHDKVIFCFLYKFRQRFAVVANEIAERLGLDVDVEWYRKNGMFLDDLGCCSQPCEC